MNSIERVLAAIQGKPKDRLPLSLTLSLYGAGLTNSPLYDYYTDPVKYVNGQKKVFEVIHPDIIFSPFSLPFYGKAFGSEIIFLEEQPPNLKRPIVRKNEDLKSLDLKKAINSAEVNYFIHSTEGLSKELGDEAIIAAIAMSPFDMPVMLMGLENWLDLLLTDYDEANKLIEKLSAFFIQLTDMFFAAGASMVVLPGIFINPKIITAKLAEEVAENVNETFGQVKGPLVLHSGGAKMQSFLDSYKGLNNVAGFVINSDDNLKKVREKLTGKQVIVGNIEGPDLEKMSVREISDKTLEICDNFSSDKNFIFGSSGADIPYNTPIENILAIKRELESYNGGK